MVLYISVKFYQNVSFLHTERIRIHGRNGYILCSKDIYSKRRQTRVTGHMFCTLPFGVLYFYEVYENFSIGISKKRTRMMNRQLTDRRTNTPNYGWYNEFLGGGA